MIGTGFMAFLCVLGLALPYLSTRFCFLSSTKVLPGYLDDPPNFRIFFKRMMFPLFLVFFVVLRLSCSTSADPV